MLPSYFLLFLTSLFSSVPLSCPYSAIQVQSPPVPLAAAKQLTHYPASHNGEDLPSYRVPYRLTDTRHLLVRAKLNGKGPFNFIVDTGAPAVFVARETAVKVGIIARADGWATVANLEVEGGAVVKQISVRLDDPTQLTGLNLLGLAGVHIDGILGYNLLARFRMEIDLTQSKMVWTQVKTVPENVASARQLPGGKPFTPSKGMAQMDSMAKMAASMMQKMRSETKIGRENEVKSAARPPVQSGIKSTDEAKNETGEADKKLIPDAKQSGKKGVRILHVLAGSPAATAGVQAGDVLKGLALGTAEWQPVATGAEALRLTQMMEAGNVVRLQILRGDENLEIAVKAGKGGL